jgi:hypothetical protein
VTLPVHKFLDPLEALLREEEETCKGCRFRKVIDGRLQCTHPRTADPLQNTRCTEYEERQ